MTIFFLCKVFPYRVGDVESGKNLFGGHPAECRLQYDWKIIPEHAPDCIDTHSIGTNNQVALILLHGIQNLLSSFFWRNTGGANELIMSVFARL